MCIRDRQWACVDHATLTEPHFDEVRENAGAIEILLLGCGAQATAPRSDLIDLLRRDGIVLETMDTGAACRTFNVLLHEDRRVAAALIAVD